MRHRRAGTGGVVRELRERKDEREQLVDTLKLNVESLG